MDTIAHQEGSVKGSQLEPEGVQPCCTDECDLAPFGYLILDRSGVVTWASPAATQLLAAERHDLVGKKLSRFAISDSKRVLHSHIKTALTSDSQQTCELAMQRSKGDCFFALLQSRAETRDNGHASQCRTAIIDISERKYAEEQVTRRARRAEALCGLAHVASEVLSLERPLDDLAARAAEAMGMDLGGILILDRERQRLALRARYGMGSLDEKRLPTVQLDGAEYGRLLDWRAAEVPVSEVLGADTLERMAEATGTNQVEVSFTTPVLVKGEVEGLLIVGSHHCESAPDDPGLLEAVTCEIGLALRSARLLEASTRLSMMDELTQLHNRRHFDAVLSTEVGRVQRYGGCFSLAMIDLDGFKEYNDLLGHAAGDSVLRSVGEAVRFSLRETDAAFRYGGDEFVVVLPETGAVHAGTVVNRIRSVWSHFLERYHLPHNARLGFSCGIAEFPKDAETGDGTVFVADMALYHAKRSGGGKSTLVSDLATDMFDLPQVLALASGVDARERLVHSHSKSVADICVAIGRAIGLPRHELASLKTAALLHDIGKVGIPRSILAKPSSLDRAEYRLMQQHTTEGARMVGHVGELAELAPAIRHHHERYDGAGYPDGLKGESIPLASRIIGVAEAYDAMTTQRAYRQTLSHQEACAELKRFARTQFDDRVVQAFHRSVLMATGRMKTAE